MLRVLLFNLGISMLIQMLFFSYAAIKKSDKVTDLSYGLSFLILAVYNLVVVGEYSLPKVLLTIMVVVWSVRLATYLFIRILKTKKDKRFDEIRGRFWKFLSFWVLQGFSVWAVSISTIVYLNTDLDKWNGIFVWFGFIIAMAGLLIETVADIQKFRFKSDPKNKGKWIESGLWYYSRHPNYFGEIMMWVGVFVLTVSVPGNLWLKVISPIFITSLLLFVSGIPTLENRYDERYKDNEDYQRYKETTSVLIPLPKML